MSSTKQIVYHLAEVRKTANTTNNKRKGHLTQNELRKIMKKITIILMLVTAILLAGCAKNIPADKNNNLTIHGSGNLVSEEIQVAEFDRLEAGLHFNLTVRRGEDSKVTVTSDDNFIQYIYVDQVGSTLTFSLKPGYAYNINKVTLNVDVTLPDLAGLTLWGSSHTRLVGTKSTEKLEAALSGSSVLDGNLQAREATFELSGSTYLNLAGTAEQVNLESCGNSVADLQRFSVEKANLEVSCNSITSVRVDGTLDVEASQFAQVFYFGKPASVNNAISQSAHVESK